MSRRQNDFRPTSHGPTHWSSPQHAHQLSPPEVVGSRASRSRASRGPSPPPPPPHQQHVSALGHPDFSHAHFHEALIPHTAPPPVQQQQSAYTYNSYPSDPHSGHATRNWVASQGQHHRSVPLFYDPSPLEEEELVVRDPLEHHAPPSGHYPAPFTYDQTDIQPPIVQTRHQPAHPSTSKTATVPNLLSQARAHIVGQMKFSLSVRQQPNAARACGSGERDRRNIDPPPIVQLHIEAPDISKEEVRKYLRYEGYVMNCLIYDSEGTKDASHMPSEYRYQRRLTGSLVSTPFYGRDDSGKEGCFFPFADLSVRTLGRYRLNFSLVMLDTSNLTRNAHFPTLAETMSGPFDAYTAKDFPGIQESSRLVRALREQGCIIAIKKGNDKKKKAKEREMEGEEDGGEDDGGEDDEDEDYE